MNKTLIINNNHKYVVIFLTKNKTLTSFITKREIISNKYATDTGEFSAKPKNLLRYPGINVVGKASQRGCAAWLY
jgi:hypothetical protein